MHDFKIKRCIGFESILTYLHQYRIQLYTIYAAELNDNARGRDMFRLHATVWPV